MVNKQGLSSKTINKLSDSLVFFILVVLGWVIVQYVVHNNGLRNPKEPIALNNFPQTVSWVFKADEKVVTTPIKDGDFIYVRTSGAIYKIDGNSGKLVWKVATEASDKSSVIFPTLKPKINGIYLVVPEKGSRVAVFSSDTGKFIWRSLPPGYEQANIESYTINQEFLYVARWDWFLTAYDLKTGDVLWEKSITGRSNPYIVSGGNHIYVAQEDLLQVFESQSGRFQWKFDIGGYSGPMWLDDEVLYLTDERASRVIAININSQKLLWDKTFPHIGSYEFNCIFISKDILYLSAQQLVAISKFDGKHSWTSQETGSLECPVEVFGSIFVRNSDTNLFRISAQTGEKLGELSVQANASAKHQPDRGPLIFDDLLIVPFGDNRVFAYKIDE
ncbi:MAG: PQQ-binding-like beta-propeller repeat protein [Anaerolineales bacterium]|nr:PQQ-binding-like beta-propeller repeat protein [Anaerolineales bacterium]